jgi:hypothetical protein
MNTIREGAHRLRLQPFVEEDQPLLRFFPDRYYGIVIPCMGFSMLLGSVLLFVGGVLLFEQRKRYRQVNPQA